MGAYMASLTRLYEREDAVYYPAHGPAVENPRQLVRGMLGHRRQREAQILRLLGKGPQRIIEMVPQMYKGLDPRLNGAAGRSVLAHLVELEKQGRAAMEDETWRLS
jgi:glyoxylase-like metal-dependent hydrolase (beta-lactamase superfamily II)